MCRSTNERSGTYAFIAGRQLDGFMVRLKADGSKWYFDNAGLPVMTGTKWFAGMD